MSGNMLTTEELDKIDTLLRAEERACKKAMLYARTLTDEKLAFAVGKIAENHRKRFHILLEML